MNIIVQSGKKSATAQCDSVIIEGLPITREAVNILKKSAQFTAIQVRHEARSRVVHFLSDLLIKMTEHHTIYQLAAAIVDSKANKQGYGYKYLYQQLSRIRSGHAAFVPKPILRTVLEFTMSK